MLTAELDHEWYHKGIDGYLYAVQYEDGLVKMGYTSNPSQRFEHLEQYYRGRPMRIIREYVSDMVYKCRLQEARAMMGLMPVYRKELFDIPFWEAVKRIVITVACSEDTPL